MIQKRFLLRFVSVVVVSVLALAGSVAVQAESPPEKEMQAAPRKGSKKKAWKHTFRVKGDLQFDDNVFRLSERQKRRLETAGADEAINGRFRDMDDTSDFVVTPSLVWEAEGPGLGGRELSLEAEAGYNFYFRNTEHSFFEFDISAKQKTSKNGRVRVRFELIPSYFPKNYLADATDLTGEVEASELVFRPGNYVQWDLSGDYRHRLFKSGDRRLYVLVGAGFLQRRYDSPFEGRDRDAPYGELELQLELTRRWEAEFGIRLMAADSPRRLEVLILDEPDFGVDFNSDGDAGDINLRTVQSVDRTFTEQRFEVSTRYELRKRTYIELSYNRRNRHYSSHEPFDVNHSERFDGRDRIDVELEFRPMRGTRLTTGYGFIRQTSNRPADPGRVGEITDYRRSLAHVEFSMRF